MEPMTADELKQFAPRARPEYIEALAGGWTEFERAGVNTPLRLCEFLAQAAHECGGFTILTENLSYTAKRMCQVWPTRFRSSIDPRAMMCAGQPKKLAEIVYGSRLGNCEKGDGYRYRGRGIFQDTGRDCYQEYGALIGQDLETYPELLEKPAISLRVALARWKNLNLNRFADRHYTRAIGNAINRGNPYSSLDPIGHQDRMAWFSRAWVIFGDDGPVTALPGMALGAHGVKVEALQQRLRELGYGVGKIDRVFGTTTARAVAAFKMDHKRQTGHDLEPDEVVGPLTEAALEHGARIEISEERSVATPSDLVAAGSTEAIASKEQMAAGTGLVALSSVKAAQETGALEGLQSSIGWVPAMHSFMVPVIEAVGWGFKNFFWVLTLVGGVWVWRGGYKNLWARVKAHRLGFNLFR